MHLFQRDGVAAGANLRPVTAIPIRLRGETLPMTTELLDKYNVQGPRYTSYPTAPEWKEGIGPSDYEAACARANAKKSPVSLYVHLPFCDEQCWFCGCFMKVVPKPERKGDDRAEIEPYLADVHREIDLLAKRIDASRPVAQVHWGGGTPTYLTPSQADRLAQHLLETFRPAKGAEVSVEVDPRVTTAKHLEVLESRGFNRVSMGVQDFDPEVQELVNRVQPFDMTKALVDAARSLGYGSVNLDMIYGLPGQTRAGFEKSVEQIISLRPDRVAMYSYAHVPWLKRPQRVLAAHLPEGTEKFAIFVSGIERFVAAGYVYIGMDHFALPHDEIVKAQQDRTLTRNFQGYTTHAGCDLYGMGVSAIGIGGRRVPPEHEGLRRVPRRDGRRPLRDGEGLPRLGRRRPAPRGHHAPPLPLRDRQARRREDVRPALLRRDVRACGRAAARVRGRRDGRGHAGRDPGDEHGTYLHPERGHAVRRLPREEGRGRAEDLLAYPVGGAAEATGAFLRR